MRIDLLPVFPEIAGAVAHRVAVLAEEERLGELLVLTVVSAPLGIRVHMALDVDRLGVLYALLVVLVRTFVVYEP